MPPQNRVDSKSSQLDPDRQTKSPPDDSEANDISFRKWLVTLGKSRPAQLLAIVTAVNAGLNMLNAWNLPEVLKHLSPWLMAVHHSLQALVILALMLFLVPNRCAEITGMKDEALEFAANVQDQFYAYFRWIWISWFFLYVVMAFLAFGIQSMIVGYTTPPTKTDSNQNPDLIGYVKTNLVSYLKSENDEQLSGAFLDEMAKSPNTSIDESFIRKSVRSLEDAEYQGKVLPHSKELALLKDFRRIFILESFLKHLFGNLQTLAFISSYFVLLCKKRNHSHSADLGAVPFLLVIVLLLALCELMMIVLNSHYHTLQIFNWLTSIFAGVSMALLYSRLESRRLDGPGWVTSILFAYAVLQIADTLPQVTIAEKVLKSVVYSGYLIGKLVFFVFVLWLLESGLMLYYIYSRIVSISTDEQARRTFLLEHVTASRNSRNQGVQP